jgi:hypothetical protein
MKREQKAFVMLMAACMAFTGISSLMSASAAPVSLKQAQIGNYLDDGARNETSPAEIVLPSGRKVIKKTDASAPKTTSKVVSLEQQEQQQVTATKDGRRVIKPKKAAAQTEEEQPRASLSMAARG